MALYKLNRALTRTQFSSVQFSDRIWPNVKWVGSGKLNETHLYLHVSMCFVASYSFNVLPRIYASHSLIWRLRWRVVAT